MYVVRSLTMLTVDRIMAYGPCYYEEHIQELFGDRDSIDIDDVLNEKTPTPDKIWLLSQDWIDDGLREEWGVRAIARHIKNHLSDSKWKEEYSQDQSEMLAQYRVCSKGDQDVFDCFLYAESLYSCLQGIMLYSDSETMSIEVAAQIEDFKELREKYDEA